MSKADAWHRPVMADEAVGYLITRPEGVYVDATAGGGAHSHLIVSKLHSSGKLLAIDRDDEAVAKTKSRLEKFSSQVKVLRGDFAGMRELAIEAGIAEVNGILFDLGVSSHQLDSAQRGFSYRESGPLDFRMDRRDTLTAADVINGYSAEELARIFFELGEEKNSRKIAAAIVAARQKSRLTDTAQLAKAVSSVTNPRWINKTLSRVFQSVRLVVNDEINQLKNGLDSGLSLLASGGRMVVISYHSLEDRIVKNFVRDNAREQAAVPGESTPFRPALVRAITKKPVLASDAEIKDNPRARSAKMRVAERI